ncbi:energy transducer TonB [Lignipirellula cremea]|uniref:energy transducer TonB n=1 Tax=Lignipirellula cremea TaxID=2528010 RepID=UPI00119EB248|nr:energy transducer TonB [Lignipirellula cremea]
MQPTLSKAFTLSLVAHGAALTACLWTIPQQHFAVAGSQTAIYLEASLAQPALEQVEETVPIEVEPEAEASPPTPVEPEPPVEPAPPLLPEPETREPLPPVPEVKTLVETNTPPPVLTVALLPVPRTQAVAAEPPAAAKPESRPRERVAVPLAVRRPEPEERIVEKPPEQPKRPLRTAPSVTQPPAVAATVQLGVETKTPPDFSSNQAPQYPAEAVRRGWEGTVMLELEVAASGRVGRVTILQSSGYPILDRAAVNAVQKWRGEPAQLFGAAIPTTEKLPVRFRLRD